MKKAILRNVLMAFFIVLVTAACEFSVSTANIRDARMARDNAGLDPTTVFTQDAVFYCIVELENAPDDTTVKVVWYAVDVENTEKNVLIDEYETTGNDAFLPFSLTNQAGLWPRGDYKVEIYLNGDLDRTLEFEVQ